MDNLACEQAHLPHIIKTHKNQAHIIKKHFNLLLSSNRCKSVFQNPPVVAFRRSPNLRDLLVTEARSMGRGKSLFLAPFFSPSPFCVFLCLKVLTSEPARRLWITRSIGFDSSYPVNDNLSAGQLYPTLEQLRPEY